MAASRDVEAIDYLISKGYEPDLVREFVRKMGEGLHPHPDELGFPVRSQDAEFTRAQCEAWLENPGINPVTGRKIILEGPTFERYARACLEHGINIKERVDRNSAFAPLMFLNIIRSLYNQNRFIKFIVDSQRIDARTAQLNLWKVFLTNPRAPEIIEQLGAMSASPSWKSSRNITEHMDNPAVISVINWAKELAEQQLRAEKQQRLRRIELEKQHRLIEERRRRAEWNRCVEDSRRVGYSSRSLTLEQLYIWLNNEYFRCDDVATAAGRKESFDIYARRILPPEQLMLLRRYYGYPLMPASARGGRTRP